MKREITAIGNVSISVGWENNHLVLILENCGQNSVEIDIRYRCINESYTRSWYRCFLSQGYPETLNLPEKFKQWEGLYFQVGKEKSGPDAIEVLKKLSGEVEKQEKIRHAQQGNAQLSTELVQEKSFPPGYEQQPFLSNSQLTEQQQSDPFAPLSKTLDEMKRKRLSRIAPWQSGDEQLSTELVQQTNPLSKRDLQNQEKNITSKLQNKSSQLECPTAERKEMVDSFKERDTELVQENGKPKTMLDTRTDATLGSPEEVFCQAANYILQMSFTQQEKTIQVPILMSEAIEVELSKFRERLGKQEHYLLSAANQQLAKVKELTEFKLSEMPPPEKFPKNQPKELAKLILADELASEVQFPYLGKLGKTYWEDLKAYKSRLPQVLGETQTILYRIVILLVDGFSPYRAHSSEEAEVAHSFYKDHIPNILQIAGLELVPIEIGQTKADARIHDIQGTRSGAFQRGVIADIIQHGVRRSSDQKIIRKPVVMRGEPE